MTLKDLLGAAFAYLPIPLVAFALFQIMMKGRRGMRRLYCIAALLIPWFGFLVGVALQVSIGDNCRIDFKFGEGSCRLFGIEIHDFVNALMFTWGLFAIWICKPLIMLLALWEGIARLLKRLNRPD